MLPLPTFDGEDGGGVDAGGGAVMPGFVAGAVPGGGFLWHAEIATVSPSKRAMSERRFICILRLRVGAEKVRPCRVLRPARRIRHLPQGAGFNVENPQLFLAGPFGLEDDVPRIRRPARVFILSIGGAADDLTAGH